MHRRPLPETAAALVPAAAAPAAFAQDAGIERVHMPCKGSGPSTQDPIAGRIPLSFETAAVAIPRVNAGKVRAPTVAPKPAVDRPSTEPTKVVNDGKVKPA